MMANVGSLSSLLCFGVLSSSFVFLFPPLNNVLASLQWLRGDVVGASSVAGGGKEEDWRWYMEDA